MIWTIFLQRHMEKYNVAGQSPSNNKDKMKKDAEMLANELMTIRIREGRAISELKEHKQRVMELETQVRSQSISQSIPPLSSAGIIEKLM